jgi:hypothetical protein
VLPAYLVSVQEAAMIYSKFGTLLTLVSKIESTGGRTRVQATVDGTPEVHEYDLADLKADDGLTEINAAVAALPAKVFEKRFARPRRSL